jgi:proline iminopeptidase
LGSAWQLWNDGGGRVGVAVVVAVLVVVGVLVAVEFYRRHLCRLDWFIEAVEQSLRNGEGMPPVYQSMAGPSEFTITGTLKDYDCTPQLHRLTLPTLLTCGRYDEIPPETTAWYQSLIRNSEMMVFEQSAHMPHLEETEAYIGAVQDFLHRVEIR